MECDMDRRFGAALALMRALCRMVMVKSWKAKLPVYWSTYAGLDWPWAIRPTLWVARPPQTMLEKKL